MHTVFLFWIVFNIIVVHQHGKSCKLWPRSVGQLTPFYRQISLIGQFGSPPQQDNFASFNAFGAQPAVPVQSTFDPFGSSTSQPVQQQSQPSFAAFGTTPQQPQQQPAAQPQQQSNFFDAFGSPPASSGGFNAFAVPTSSGKIHFVCAVES